MKNITQLLILSVFSLPVFALDVLVWTNEETNTNMKIVSVNEDHPCGSASEIEITAFPDSDAASEIGLEKVTEYAGEEIINQWAVPIDIYVIALESDSIFVPYRGKALQIYDDGKYRITDAPEYTSESLGQCPEFISSEYSGSSYVRCFEYVDIRSKKKRNIAYEGPCT